MLWIFSVGCQKPGTWRSNLSQITTHTGHGDTVNSSSSDISLFKLNLVLLFPYHAFGTFPSIEVPQPFALQRINQGQSTLHTLQKFWWKKRKNRDTLPSFPLYFSYLLRLPSRCFRGISAHYLINFSHKSFSLIFFNWQQNNTLWQ